MLATINGLMWAFLRRWFGGFNPLSESSRLYKVFDSRGLQTFVMVIALFLTLFDRTIAWLALCLSVWIQLQFWSRSTGEILDSGRVTQTAESYDRWFRKPLDLIYDRLGKTKYTGLYDWWYGWGLRAADDCSRRSSLRLVFYYCRPCRFAGLLRLLVVVRPCSDTL